jgi:hypothetical protein
MSDQIKLDAAPAATDAAQTETKQEAKPQPQPQGEQPKSDAPPPKVFAGKYQSRGDLTKAIVNAGDKLGIAGLTPDSLSDAAAESLYAALQRQISSAKPKEGSEPKGEAKPEQKAEAKPADPLLPKSDDIRLADPASEVKTAKKTAAEQMEAFIAKSGLDAEIVQAHYEKYKTFPKSMLAAAKEQHGWDESDLTLRADIWVTQQAAQKAAIEAERTARTNKIAEVFGGSQQWEDAKKRAGTLLSDGERRLMELGLNASDEAVRLATAQQLRTLLDRKGDRDTGTRVTATSRMATGNNEYSDEVVNGYRAKMQAGTLPPDQIAKAMEAIRKNAEGKFCK